MDGAIDSDTRNTKMQREELRAEFNRFIAKLKAEAWDEGYDARKRQAAQNPAMGVPGHEAPGNPHRDQEEA